MFVVLTVNDKAYESLANITAQNKKEYCEKHGYTFHHVTDGGSSLCGKIMSAKLQHTPPDQIPIGWGKIYAMQDILSRHPECTWILNTDCDVMITNMTIKIEDILSKSGADANTHIIIPADTNGINCGNMLIRNSPIGRAFLDVIAASLNFYRNWYLQENQCIQDLLVGTFLTEQGVKNGGTLWSNVSRVIPQRIMNSYDYKNLPLFKNRKDVKDIFGNDGQWQKGDFIIQWPATPLEYRLKVASIYNSLTIV
jgi:hypothetical protein